jgi:hypothetical protein
LDRREPGFCSGNHIEVSEERIEARAWLDFDLTKGLVRGELAPPEGAPLRKFGVGRWGASNRTKEKVTRPWHIKLQLRAIHEKEPLSDSRRSGGDGKHAVPVLEEQCAQRVIKRLQHVTRRGHVFFDKQHSQRQRAEGKQPKDGLEGRADVLKSA